MAEPTIIHASSQKESPHDVLLRIGVEVIEEKGGKTIWHYQDKTVFQPDFVQNFEDKMLEYFNIKIVWYDEQLKMF
jgi:hypothetical protein